LVASVATHYQGKGAILRAVFRHSLSWLRWSGALVMLQAYVFPFTALVLE
jgi:lactate permease